MGAGFGLCGQFELSGGEVSQRGVSTDAVIKDFDVFKQALAGFVSGLIPLVMNEFFLQGGKEAFHRRVVPTVGLSAHRTRDAVLCQ